MQQPDQPSSSTPLPIKMPAVLATDAGVMWTYTLTTFLSALLLFSVQPMFAKMVLPVLGGSPSVWAVAMFFFQAALLAVSGIAGLTLGDAAYFYALQTIGPRRGALVLSLHPVFTALLAVAFAIAFMAMPMSMWAHHVAGGSAASEVGRPDFLRALYFSVSTLMTLGLGDEVPVTGLGRLVTMTEVVVGYVMLGGLLSIFANKLARLS